MLSLHFPSFPYQHLFLLPWWPNINCPLLSTQQNCSPLLRPSVSHAKTTLLCKPTTFLEGGGSTPQHLKKIRYWNSNPPTLDSKLAVGTLATTWELENRVRKRKRRRWILRRSSKACTAWKEGSLVSSHEHEGPALLFDPISTTFLPKSKTQERQKKPILEGYSKSLRFEVLLMKK